MAARKKGGAKVKPPPNATSRFTKTLSSYRFHFIMALVAIVILAGGYAFYHLQEQQMRQRTESSLSLVAKSKADQIADWRSARLVDANTLAGSPSFTDTVAEYIATPTDNEARDKVRADLAIVAQSYPYQDILLVDVNGNVLLNTNNTVASLSNITISLIPIAIEEQQAIFTDFHFSPESDSPSLDVIAPIYPWRQDSPTAIGAVVLSIDPSRYLYPLVQSFPMPSQTGEALLVERDGDQVLFLNELRHQQDTALKLRIPLTRQDVPAVMAVLGKEGVFEGRDYRGVSVLSAIEHIADSPWYLVSKIDISEALSTWHSRLGFIIALFAGIMAAALALVGLIWQRRRRQVYQKLYEAQLETRALRSHFDYLVKYANDIILLIDENNKHIVEVNDRALETYGYTRKEMLGMPLQVLVAPSDLNSHKARLNKIGQEGKIVAEGLHRHKDGSTFPIEVSGRTIQIEDNKYIQAIIRDITERKQVEETLRESEEKFRSVFDNNADAIFLTTPDGEIIEANPAACRIFGYTEEEFRRYGRNVIVDASDPRLIAALEQRRRTGIFKGELNFRRKNGTRFAGEISSVVFKDKDGRDRTSMVVRDITERKQAEQALHDSEERYRALVQQSLVGIGLSHQNQIIFANPALLDIFGYNDLEEFIRKPLLNHVTPLAREHIVDRMERVSLGEPVEADFELDILRKDGEVRTLNATSSHVTMGGEMYTQTIFQDVTKDKQTEEALRQSEERYRTILEQMDESYYEIDLAGNFTFVNDSLCRRLGHSREELIGMNYRAYTPREITDDTFKTFNRVYRTGKPIKGAPSVAIARDGSLIFTERSVFPLLDKEGKIVGFRGISRDVTEHKRAEEERRQLELKSQISSRLASVGEMAAGVAHEINNPLTAVTGYAQLLVNREDIPPDIRSDLEAINDGAQRVAGIVQRLLAFSRQTKPQRKFVDINELIESTLILRAYQLRVNNIEVITRLYPDLLETVVDPGQIQQVLLNLIVNAETEMKLARGKGRLTITTEKNDNTIKICAKDNGPGIRPDIIDRIFDPFFTTKETGQGTGLGLSLCYGIITEHKGKIYVESKPGKGATFIIELPVVKEFTSPEQAKLQFEPVKATKARILVVDDEQVIRDVVRRVLAGEGHKVEAVDNAAGALKKIESKKYNLILVDIKMPGMNGVELFKRIRKIDKSLAGKVVFITGDIMSADTEKFLSRTKVSHISKPFNAEQLKTEITRALTINS